MIMCWSGLHLWMGQYVRQCKARYRYRLDRWRSRRARQKWIQRQELFRKELLYQKYIYSSSADQSLFMSQSTLIIRPNIEYNNTQEEQALVIISCLPNTDDNNKYIVSADDIINYQAINTNNSYDLAVQTDTNSNNSVGVISPHHLSQRLNDNSLARIAVGESDAELVQYLRDERIALFLQNDEFMTELRTNRDFMHTLQSELEEEARCNGNIDSNKRGEESSESVSETTTSTLKHNTLGHIDDDTLKARIATMGKVSRKKFAQIARVFSRSKRSSSARTLLQGGAGGSTNGKDQLIDDTLVEEDEEREIRQSNSEERSSPKNVN